MESTPSKMESRPPEVIEALLGSLLPPACREHVLGDLYERYTSTPQYLADALRTVPLVIFSQIRRATDPQLFVMQLFALGASFLATAWQLGGRSFLYEQSGFARLTIPVMSALLALMLRDAYTDRGERSRYKTLMDAVVAIAAAFLSQAFLLMVGLAATVPHWIMLSGGGMSLLLLSTFRMLFSPGGKRPRAALEAGTTQGRPPMSLDEIRRKSQEFERKVRINILALSVVAIVIAFLGSKTAFAKPVSARIVGGAIIAVSVYLMYQLHRRNAAGAVHAVPPDASLPASLELYRAQLQRRRDALRRIWWWCAGPILAALLAFALQGPLLLRPDRPGMWRSITPFVVLCFIWCLALLRQSQVAARRIQKEIERLDALQKER